MATYAQQLFAMPTINAEEIFRPIHLGLERKRRGEQDIAREESRSQSEMMQAKADARAERTADRQDKQLEASLKAAGKTAELMDFQIARENAQYLFDAGKYEALDSSYPERYKKLMAGLEDKKLRRELLKGQILKQKKSMELLDTKVKQFNATKDVQKKINTLGVWSKQLRTSGANLISKLESSGLLSEANAKLIRAQEESPEFYAGLSNELAKKLEPKLRIDKETQRDLDSFGNAVSAYMAMSKEVGSPSAETKLVDIKLEPSARTNIHPAFKSFVNVVKTLGYEGKKPSKDKSGAYLSARNMFGEKVANGLSVYITDDIIPKEILKDISKTLAFKKLAIQYAKDIREFHKIPAIYDD